MGYDNYHYYSTFRKDYQEKYGRQPYIEPGVQFEW